MGVDMTTLILISCPYKTGRMEDGAAANAWHPTLPHMDKE